MMRFGRGSGNGQRGRGKGQYFQWNAHTVSFSGDYIGFAYDNPIDIEVSDGSRRNFHTLARLV